MKARFWIFLLFIGLATGVASCKITNDTDDARTQGAEEQSADEKEDAQGGPKDKNKAKSSEDNKESAVIHGEFPPNGSFALQSINGENPNFDFVISEDPTLETFDNQFMQVQSENHGATSVDIYVQLDNSGHSRVLFYAGDELGYIDPRNGTFLLCGRYNPFGTIIMDVLGCRPIGSLNDIVSSYSVVYNNGQRVRSSNTYYHDNGYTMRSSSGTWYYRNGNTMMSSSGYLYWPNGDTMYSPSTKRWYYRGNSTMSGYGRLYYRYDGDIFAENGTTRYRSGYYMQNSSGQLRYDHYSKVIASGGTIYAYDGDYIKSGTTIYHSNDSYQTPLYRKVRESFSDGYRHVDIEASKHSDYVVITSHGLQGSGGTYITYRNRNGDVKADVTDTLGTRISPDSEFALGVSHLGGDPLTRSFKVTNDGILPLNVNSVALLPKGASDDTSLFSLTGFGGPVTLQVGESLTINLTMAATQSSGGEATVQVKTTDGNTPTWEFSVSGTVLPKEGDGLTAEYFNNTTLTGPPAFVRYDPQVAFNWGAGTPGGTLPADFYSVRWSGQLMVPYDGTYTITTYADDGTRMWIDGQLAFDHWVLTSGSTVGVERQLEAGRIYDIKLEYFENAGNSLVYLRWSHDKIPNGPIETKYLISRPAPKAAAQFSATATSTADIALSWQDTSPFETNYQLKISEAGAPYTLVGLLPPNTTQYAMGSLTPGTAYQFQLTAVNDEGDSDPVYASATTLSIPTAPESFTAIAISPTSIKLDWQDTSSSETGFRLERSTDGANFSDLTTLPANTVTYTDSALTPNTSYHYRLRAISPGGDSGTVTAQELAMVLPQAPTQFAATILSNIAVQLAWQDNATYETGYEVLQSDDGENFASIASLPIDSQTHGIINLNPGATYKFRVYATNAKGNSDAIEVEVQTPPLPSVPSNFAATATSAYEIKLTWGNSSSTESGFLIERSDDGITYSDLSTTAENTTNYTDEALTPNTQYYYRIRAISPGGESPTALAQATTMALPDPPLNLTIAAISHSAIRLDWQDGGEHETGYRISRSEDGANYTQIGTVAANGTYYTDFGLTPETTYFYKVSSFNMAGISDPLEGDQTTPAEASPGPITVPPVPSTSGDNWASVHLITSNAPVTSYPNGTTELPPTLTWVDEWTGHQLELWVKLTDTPPSNDGVLKTIIDYDANSRTVAGITFTNPASTFSDINDVNGSVAIQAQLAMDSWQVGRYYRLAMLTFVSAADDLDLPIEEFEKPAAVNAPYALLGTQVALTQPASDFAIANTDVTLEIWPVPYDADDNGAINFRDLTLFASIYGNEVSPTNRYTYAFDFNGDGFVNFRDLTLFASNYGASKLNWNSNYPSTFPDHLRPNN